jgi:peptidoglycan/LPS O-acetylase OafA/YrhL
MSTKKPADHKPSPHLGHLDGIRGLAALYVVLHHVYLQAVPGTFRPQLQVVTRWLEYGHLAVAVFIVLSGYCLMIPVARNGDIRGGTLSFLRRRTHRILPPYYVALLFSVALVSLIPGLSQIHGTLWDTALPALSAKAILSHLFLVHNLSSGTFFKINPPLWSVATEFQIYFFFPLLLLPVFKKLGMAVTLATAFGVGFAPLLLLGQGEGASPWFLGLFALGMAASNYSFAPPEKIRKRIDARWFVVLALLMVLVFLALNVFRHVWFNSQFYAMDIICGLTTTFFLLFYFELVKDATTGVLSFLRAVLESKVVVGLGLFSYSLYLIHMPVLAWFDLGLRRLNLAADTRFAVLLLGGTLLSVALAYVFHLVIERRFMSGGKKSHS